MCTHLFIDHCRAISSPCVKCLQLVSTVKLFNREIFLIYGSQVCTQPLFIWKQEMSLGVRLGGGCSFVRLEYEKAAITVYFNHVCITLWFSQAWTLTLKCLEGRPRTNQKCIQKSLPHGFILIDPFWFPQYHREPYSGYFSLWCMFFCG